MDSNSKGWLPHLDPFHEFLEEERRRLSRRPTRMQKLAFKNGLDIENELMNARRYDLGIRLHN